MLTLASYGETTQALSASHISVYFTGGEAA
jgi:hypothetical protein